MKTMFKRCKVVMLPTNQKAQIVLGQILAHMGETDIPNDNHITKQHLYIISDDEIKKGDYITDTKKVYKAPDIDGFIGLYKIIATTDKSLYDIVSEDPSYPNNTSQVYLPQPSQSFIQKYVDEYNKGNIITYVMVEYEKHFDEDWSDISGAFEIEYETLKVNSKDNTITIRRADPKAENMLKFVDSIIAEFPEINLEYLKIRAENWIETNL